MCAVTGTMFATKSDVGGGVTTSTLFPTLHFFAMRDAALMIEQT
jgi:hypothetical protein